MTAEEAVAVIVSFPEVTEGTAWGKPAYKAMGKFFTRLRAEDDSLVLMDVGFDEREMLIDVEPATFHLTDHYRNYPAVLARIATLDPGTLRGLLERRWRKLATKTQLKAYQAERDRQL